MARATTGGRKRIGGGRRPCRRLLPAWLLLALLIPTPAVAESSADAWMSARQTHVSNATAIGAAAAGLADGTSPREVRRLRSTVRRAVRSIDALDVRACFRVWWSYVRSSYVMFDRALVAVERNDLPQVQSAITASRFMSAMAASTSVDCPRDDSLVAVSLDPVAVRGDVATALGRLPG